MKVYGERFVHMACIFYFHFNRSIGRLGIRVFKNMLHSCRTYGHYQIYSGMARNALLIIIARGLIEIILHAGGNLCTWRSRHHDKWPPKSIRSSSQAREYFFLDTSLPPERVYLSSSSLVLIVFSITNVSNETDIPKQEPPEGPGREIGFRLRGRINARGRLIRQY